MVFHRNSRCTLSVGVEDDRYMISEIRNGPEEVTHYSRGDISTFKDREVLLNLDKDHISYLFMRSSLKNKKKAEEEILKRARSSVEDSDNYDFFIKRTGSTYVVFYTKKDLFTSLSLSLELKDVIVYPAILGPYNYWCYHYHKSKVKNPVIIQMQKKETTIFFIREGDLYDIKIIPIGIEDYREVSDILKFPERPSSQEESHSLRSLKRVNLNWMREIRHSLSATYTSDSPPSEVFLLGYENTVYNLHLLLEGYLKLTVHPSIERGHSFSNLGVMGNLFALRGEKLNERKDNIILIRLKGLYNHMKTARRYLLRSKKTLHNPLRSS